MLGNGANTATALSTKAVTGAYHAQKTGKTEEVRHGGHLGILNLLRQIILGVKYHKSIRLQGIQKL